MIIHTTIVNHIAAAVSVKLIEIGFFCLILQPYVQVSFEAMYFYKIRIITADMHDYHMIATISFPPRKPQTEVKFQGN